ncbi:hypothetical protein [Flavobacterium flavigenum]|uniref:hypothetical protein n=1 Tax=Flavobacterium flavigenum TaxID=3003258 RepID=UPI002482548E|nr:hypothetical protein [Flavobacterium flavigenum]
MKLIIQLLFLFFFNFTVSQDYREATILFNDSSSVKGYGEIRNNAIYFKVQQKDKPSKWSFDITKGLLFSGYGYSEKYEYVKFEKNTNPKIMEVMEEGRLTLYRFSKSVYRNNGFTSQNGLMNSFLTEGLKETYYVKRKNEELATDISFSFKFRSKIYFSDCEKIIQKINKGKFTKNNIPEIVYYYNDYCDETEDNIN